MKAITGKNVLLDANDEPCARTIWIGEDGKISKIELGYQPSDGVIDAKEHMVMPGLVDAHVHINEPGRTDWEGFETATKAASAGGVTTLIDMPLNAIPPTTTCENLQVKRQAAYNQCWVDVGFYGGVIPGNQTELTPMVKMGVRGFKCFMIESGVEEFPHVTDDDARKALTALTGTDTFLMFHAEKSDGCCALAVKTQDNEYITFLESRPKEMEHRAIETVIDLCRDFDFPCHVVHLSSANALPMIRKAKADKLKLTVETCFHYLFFDAESIPNGHTQYKCCPPIREATNKDLLWKGLMDGTIDYVVSDHSPCTTDLKLLKLGDFMKAWGGVASVQFGLLIVWTEGRQRGVKFQDIVKWCCTNTANQVGLGDRKGRLAVGLDADFVIWDPEAQIVIETSDVLFKNKVTPYEKKKMCGRVIKTILRGQVIYDYASGVLSRPIGNLL